MVTKTDRNEYLRKWRIENPEKVRAANKRKYQSDKIKNPERLKKKGIYAKQWRKKNYDSHREYKKLWSRKKLGAIKEKIFDKYGHQCFVCGFSDKRALCIDHINGGGFSELRKLTVFRYYEKVLEDNNSTYQILCHNCNWIKRHQNNETRKPIIKLMEQDKKALVNEIKKTEI